MLHRSINGIFILAAVLVLTAGSVVYAQKASDTAGGSPGGAGKIGVSDGIQASPLARPNIGSPDGGFSRQRAPSQVDIVPAKRAPSSSTARPGSIIPPGPIPIINEPTSRAAGKTTSTAPARPTSLGPDPYQYLNEQPTSIAPLGPIPIINEPAGRKASTAIQEKRPTGCADCYEPVPMSRTSALPGPIPIINEPTSKPGKVAPEPVPIRDPRVPPIPNKEPLPSAKQPTSRTAGQQKLPSGCADCYEPLPARTTALPGPIPILNEPAGRKADKDPAKLPPPIKDPRVPPIPNKEPLRGPAAPVVIVTDKYAPK